VLEERSDINVADGSRARLDERQATKALAPVSEVALQRCLLCELGEMRFAVPLARLHGVEPYARVTPLPRLPGWVIGVTNVRGAVVGVVDLARFLNLGETRLGHGRLLLCSAGPYQIALAVTTAQSLVDCPQSALRQPPNVNGRLARYVAGLVSDDDTPVLLLDVERLLASGELISG
jgi:purine-binding chemotaxis protein CheW